jgi:alpha-L-glutamate ligase-like protein
MFGWASRLTGLGVLGLNRRNLDYVLRHNKRRLYPLVDDKLRTKELAMKAGMAVTELYGVIEAAHQIRNLSHMLKGRPGFVIKPARGSGGKGIFAFSGRVKENYRMTDGTIMTQAELNYNVLSMLSGIYSLSGLPDRALIEYHVQFDPLFEAVSYLGVPDIRIIAFLGVPTMAMVRLPTRMSGGKANLHQGAVGAGVDMATGKTLSAVWLNDIVTEHPDTGNSVTGLQIPRWEGLLQLAARCYELTGLGYQGVDIVLDRDKGPLILELNARPGLNIQIANREGLLQRLRVVEEHHKKLNTIEERVAFCKEHFHASAQ